MQTVKVPFKFHGGLNNAQHPTQIALHELQVCTDISYARESTGAIRPGYTKFNPTRFADGGGGIFKILGLASFAYSTGNWRDIFVGRALGGGLSLELWYVTGPAAKTWVPFDLTSVGIGGQDYPFSFVRLGNRILATNGDTTPFVWNGTSASAKAIGIAAPATAPTSVLNGAGQMRGNYRYKVLFADTTYGTYGDESPASTVIQVSSQQIRVAAIPVSANGRVNARRLYRTRANGSEYFFRTQIADNATTTFDDNATDSILGANIIDEKGGQPPRCRFIAMVAGIVVMFNDPNTNNYSTAYYSTAGFPEHFKPANVQKLQEGDGDPGTGMFVLNGQLVMTKSRRLMHFDGHPTEFLNIYDQDDAVGMRWPYSGTRVGDNILVFMGEQGIYVYNGQSAMLIKDERGNFPLAGTYRTIGNPPSFATGNYGREPRAHYDDKENQVLFSFRNDTTNNANNRSMVWHPNRPGQPWSLYSYGFDCSGEWHHNFSGEKTFVFGSRDANGFIFRANQGTRDRVDTTGNTSGTVKSVAGLVLTIADADADLDTTGEGLLDAYLWTRRASDGEEQSLKITANTTRTITVGAWTTFTPVAADQWAIGLILPEVQTKEFSFEEQDPAYLMANKAMKTVRLRTED